LKTIKNHSDMFRIVGDSSSGSGERAWLKLLVIFFVCVVGVWQRNYAAKHRLRTRKISRVISVKHFHHSLMMNRQRSETCRS